MEWDIEGTLTSNYGAAGFVLNPNQAVGRGRLPQGGTPQAAGGAPEGEEGGKEKKGVELENSIPAIFEEDHEPQGQSTNHLCPHATLYSTVLLFPAYTAACSRICMVLYCMLSPCVNVLHRQSGRLSQ